MTQNTKSEYDFYISFARIDNVPPPEGGEAWVDSFKKFLSSIVEQILGEKPNVLGYSNHEKPVKSELIKSGIFVCVLSPEYVKNEKCLEELAEYTDHHPEPQILKVLKFPVSFFEQPQVLQTLISYNLYDIDSITGDVREFKDFFSSDAEKIFWLKLVDLAYDISRIIQKNRSIEIKNISQNEIISKTVYLAETGTDLHLHRDIIKRELIRHGFYVLPDKELPSNLTALKVAIKKDLERSRLSIHLIGDYYGDLIPNTEMSILDLQNEMASEHGQTFSNILSDSNQKFNRLIWISPDAQLENDLQKIFVDNIRRDIEAIEDSEIIQSPIESFKSLILQTLFGIEKKRKNIVTNNHNNNKIIYLIYDEIDSYDAMQISDFLKYQNFEVIYPKFEGNLMELRETHLENLKVCDFGFIYQNKVNDLWVQMKYLDLLKAPGLGRSKSDINKAFVIGKNAKSKTDKLKKYNLPLFQQGDGAQSDLINFLNKK